MMGERTHTMSYLKTNIDAFVPSNTREFEDSEVETMTEKQFDELPLCDQISIYNRFPNAYARLTGKSAEDTAPDISDGGSEAKVAIDEFESRWQAYMDAITAHNA